jgi:hypothetical protein
VLSATDIHCRGHMTYLFSFTQHCRQCCRCSSRCCLLAGSQQLPSNAINCMLAGQHHHSTVLQGGWQRPNVAARLPRGCRPEEGRRLLVAHLGRRRLPRRPRCCPHSLEPLLTYDLPTGSCPVLLDSSLDEAAEYWGALVVRVIQKPRECVWFCSVHHGAVGPGHPRRPRRGGCAGGGRKLEGVAALRAVARPPAHRGKLLVCHCRLSEHVTVCTLPRCCATLYALPCFAEMLAATYKPDSGLGPEPPKKCAARPFSVCISNPIWVFPCRQRIWMRRRTTRWTWRPSSSSIWWVLQS